MESNTSPLKMNEKGELNLPFIILAIFTVFVFFRPQEIYPNISIIPFQKIFGVSALLSSLFLITRATWSRFKNKFTIYMSMYIFAIILSIPFGLWPGCSVRFLNDMIIKQFIILFVMIIVLDSYDKIKKLILIVALSTAVVGLLTVIRYFKGVDLLVGYRASISEAMFSDPNDLALNFVFSIPFLYFVGYKLTKRKRFFALITVVLVIATLLTFSRGGILGLCSVSFAIFYYDKKRRFRNLLIVILGIVLVSSFLPRVFERMSTLNVNKNDREASMAARLTTIKYGVKIFLENPILGVGIHNFTVAEGAKHDRFGKWNVAHNSFIQIGAETGILGLIAFLGCCISLLKIYNQMHKKFNNYKEHNEVSMIMIGIQCSAIGFIVCAIFLSQAYSWYFFYLVGFAVSAKNIAKQAPVSTDSAS